MDKQDSYSIRQNGNSILTGGGCFLKMVWRNLLGLNFSGKEYRDYIDFALSQGFKRGPIELYCENELIDKGTIK